MQRWNYDDNKVINGTNGNDFIYNDKADNVTIYAGEGNDQITNDVGSYVYLDGGDGNDVLITDRNEKSPYNGGAHSTLIGGNGDDTIDSYADNVLIDAGEGNDFVTCTDLSTVMSGTGEDLIWIYGNNGLNPPLQIVKTIITDFDENKDILMFNYDHLFENSSVNNFSITKINNGVLLKNKYYQITLIGQTTEKMKNATIAGFIDYDMNTMQYIKKQMKLSELMDSTAVNNNVINNSNNNTLISGTNGNDSIINSGSYVTVNTGAGNDTLSMIVSNSKNNYYLTLSDFSKDDVLDISDSISGFRVANVTTVGFRLLSSYYLDPNLIIDFPNIKNDKDIEELKKVHVKNGNTLTTIGELLKDIVSIDDNATIYGTNDDDVFIEVNGKNALIYGYDGNDEIHFNNTDIGKSTVYAGKGNDYVGNPHNDLRFSQDSGTRNGDGSTFYGEDGDDHFNLGNLKNVTLNGDSGKDQLSIYCSDNVVVNGGDSDDYINVVAIKNATLDGGEGNDEIRAVGDSENITITGGKGNDNIYLLASNTVIQYQLGDDNDVVENYGTEDKIKLLSGKISKAELNGNDVVIKIGDGSITLKDAKGKQVTVLDSNNKTITFTDTYDGSSTNTGTTGKKTQRDVIKDFMLSLDKTVLKGVDAVDEAIKNSSQGMFKSLDDFTTNFLIDCRYMAKSTDDFLVNYCGIVLDNEDSGAITGLDAGGTLKTDKSIIPENGKLYNLDTLYETNKLNTLNNVKVESYKPWYTLPIYSTVPNYYAKKLIFTTNGLKVNIFNYDLQHSVTLQNKVTLNESEKNIVNGLYSWWIPETLDLIADSYGENFSFTDKSSSSVKEINLSFIDFFEKVNELENKNVLASIRSNTSFLRLKKSIDLELIINTKIFKDIDVSKDVDGTREHSSVHKYLDGVLAHEMTHAIMRANINYFDYLPNVILEGMAELTRGADDRGELIQQLVSNYRDNKIETERSLYDAVKDYSSDYEDVYTICSGYMLMRYFAKQVSNNIIDFSSSAEKSIIIMGNDNKNIIKAGSGGNNIFGKLGDDTIYGGNGNDIFHYANGDGNDVIYNYTADKDKIYITSGKIDSSSINNLDLILKIGDGSITIKRGAGKNITIIEKDGTTTSKVYGEPIIPEGLKYNKNERLFTVNAKYKGNEITVDDYATSVATINASAYNKAINITGNDNDNLIKGGKGADTLDGSLGDDTLTGGKGKNTFIYDGRGSDVITDYKVGDTIQTYADVTGSAINKKNLTLTTADGGSLFIKNGKGKRITVNDLTLIYGDNAATMFANNNDTIDAKNYSMVSAVDGSKTKKSVNLTANDSGTLLKGGKAVDTLTSGTGNDTLTGNKGKDVFIYNSGDDIITDYTAGQDIIMIASDTTITASALKGKDVILTVGNQTSDSIGSLTLKKGKGKSVKIVKSLDDISLPVIYGNGNATVSIATSDGSIISDVSDNINSKNLVSAIDVSKSSKSKIIRYSDTKSIRISGGKKADTISGNSGNDTIYGNAGNDSIVGYYGDDILNGGAGNDTIIGYNGNNTLTGGKGKDIFVYGGNSNDTITDYTAGQDKVYLTDGVKFKSAIYDGKNLIFTTSSDKTLTLQNAINKKNVKQKVTIVDNGITTSQVYGESSITIANADCATINATTLINSGLTSIDASKRSKAIYIVGNNNNSTIKGSKSNDTVIAGSGANVIDSGKGNDSVKLAQNHQKSTIIYTGGNDTVTNFDLSDTISLKSGIIATASKVSNTEYVLTLKKGKTKIGTLDVSGNSAFSVDSDNNVSIGGISAKISTTSAITKAAYTEQLDAEISQLNFFQDNLLEESSDLDSILLSSNHSVFSQIPSEFCFSLNTDTLSSFSISQPDSKK